METSNHSLNTAAKALGATLIAFLTLAALMVTLAPAASAGPGPGPQIDDELIIPADLPVFDPGDIVFIPLPTISASATVECDQANVLQVVVGNSTPDFSNVNVLIDGEIATGFVLLAPNSQFLQDYAVEENSAVLVEVTVGGDKLVDEILEIDCLAPDPWFDFVPNCDLGQAWVELGNNGPDSAVMGVHYAALPYAGGLFGPGDMTVQPLAVQPNEFADFAIEVDGVAIHSDGYFFDCPVPEPVEEPIEDPVPDPTPEPEAVPAVPTPEPVTTEPVNVGADDTPTQAGDVADATPESVEPTPQPQTDAIDATDVGFDIIAGLEDGDELALAAGLDTGGQTSTGRTVLIALLLVFGVALTIGAGAALKARR